MLLTTTNLEHNLLLPKNAASFPPKVEDGVNVRREQAKYLQKRCRCDWPVPNCSGKPTDGGTCIIVQLA